MKKLLFVLSAISASQVALAEEFNIKDLSNLEIFEEFKRRGLTEDLMPAYFETECSGSALIVKLYDIQSTRDIPNKASKFVTKRSYSLVQARGIRPEAACERELGEQPRKGLFIHTQPVAFCNGSTLNYVYLNSDDLSIKEETHYAGDGLCKK